MSRSTQLELRTVLPILLIGIVLVVIHYGIPAEFQTRLAFHHSNPDPWAFLTAAYVHASTMHLAENLLGFGVGSVVAYQVCVLQGRRRWFWITTGIFLILLPVLVSLSSYLTFQSLGIAPTSRGFSGVVAGYGGFVLVALARWVADRHGAFIGRDVGQGILILLLSEVAIIYTGVPSLLVSTMLVVGLVLVGGSLLWRGVQREWTAADRRQVAVDVAFVGLEVVLLGVFVWSLFPAALVTGERTVNIIAHGAGFVWGIVLALVGEVEI